MHWWQNPSRISNTLSLVDPVGLTFISLLPTLRQVPCPGFLDTGPAISLLTALVLSPVWFDILTTWPNVGFINSIFPNTWEIQEPMPFSPSLVFLGSYKDEYLLYTYRSTIQSHAILWCIWHPFTGVPATWKPGKEDVPMRTSWKRF